MEKTTGQKAGFSKQLATLLIVVVIAATGILVVIRQNNNSDSGTSSENSSLQKTVASAEISSDGKKVNYSGVDSQSALSLLKQYTKVETKTFSGIGEYVTGINGLVATDSVNFWSFYVNDKASEVGAGEYLTKSSDKIEWRLEDVSAYNQ